MTDKSFDNHFFDRIVQFLCALLDAAHKQDKADLRSYRYKKARFSGLLDRFLRALSRLNNHFVAADCFIYQ